MGKGGFLPGIVVSVLMLDDKTASTNELYGTTKSPNVVANDLHEVPMVGTQSKLLGSVLVTETNH
jgi:hypothetical protein